jgi:triosephosphate isomerase
VILGHSQRRKLGETDEIIEQKIAMAFKHNLEIILYIDEIPQEHQSDGDFKFFEKYIDLINKFSSKIIIA